MAVVAYVAVVMHFFIGASHGDCVAILQKAFQMPVNGGKAYVGATLLRLEIKFFGGGVRALAF